MKEEKQKNTKQDIKEILMVLVPYIVIIAVVILVRIFIIDPVRVDGNSMNDTLQNGEVMILNKIVYKRHAIKRFDIVVVNEGEKLIIKRVIGLPGETISYKDNKLYINGKEIEDPYSFTKTDDFSIEDVGHTKIPGDTYFVMGDNRSFSLDSRYPSVGVIKRTQIVGRARYIIWPFEKLGRAK